MSFVKHAVIAAAGLGSRLGHGKPKCLVEVEGVSILKHLLSLLNEVEDVRVVVGFEEKAVISELQSLRRDVLIVRNPGFRSTTTLHSYEMGMRHLSGDCLFMDADLLIEPASFASFLETCRPGKPLLGITRSKTKDAVFAVMQREQVVAFERDHRTEFEWSNISWLPTSYFTNIGNTPVYEHLKRYLPFSTKELISYEIDREEDFVQARENLHLFNLASLTEERRAS